MQQERAQICAILQNCADSAELAEDRAGTIWIGFGRFSHTATCGGMVIHPWAAASGVGISAKTFKEFAISVIPRTSLRREERILRAIA